MTKILRDKEYIIYKTKYKINKLKKCYIMHNQNVLNLGKG